MQIILNRTNDAVHFTASNADGNTVDIDGSEAVGGVGAGFRPMELLLAAHAGCASMDVVSILKKQRQDLRDVQVTISGTRRDGTPSPFSEIAIHFTVFGDIDEQAAARAVSLSVEKYCSVGASLDSNIVVTHSVEVRA
ncbi:MAG: OsmC family peroxiredoxin [Spirochaetaceae bacterium]|nr:MAG: OsmC family peroxiredoxin [Spirochaetaceae bacterium]